MHDDQHGTAIISSAGLVNALQVAGKKIEDVKIVVNGAGASAVSCTKLYVSLGARLENIVMLDSKGVISKAAIRITTNVISPTIIYCLTDNLSSFSCIVCRL